MISYYTYGDKSHACQGEQKIIWEKTKRKGKKVGIIKSCRINIIKEETSLKAEDIFQKKEQENDKCRTED